MLQTLLALVDETIQFTQCKVSEPIILIQGGQRGHDDIFARRLFPRPNALVDQLAEFRGQ